MRVFKAYLKIFKKSTLMMSLMYALIFLGITIVAVNQGDNEINESFELSKCKVAVIDNDNSELSKGLQTALQKNTEIISLSNKDEENLKDTLFFRIAECIYTIPKNFESNYDFKNNNASKPIETLSIPDSTSSTLVNQLINKYLNTVDIYMKTGNMDISTAVKNTLVDLEKEVKVTIKGDVQVQSETESLIYYFNYMAYPIVAIMILAISMTFIKFNELDIKRRNICSPISMSKFNMGLLFSNFIIALGIYLLFIIMAGVFYNKTLFTVHGYLLMFNSFIFTIDCLSLSFLIANLATKNAITPISTTLSLLFSFVGGIFISQELLSGTVKNIGLFIPTFWYVKANNILTNVSSISIQTLKPYINSILIQLCFAIAFLSVALVIVKQKRVEEQ